MSIKKLWLFAVFFGAGAAALLTFVLYPEPKPLTEADSIVTTDKAVSAEEETDTNREELKQAQGKQPLDISAGKRAFSIAVNEPQGVSGFIEAESRVDVVGVLPSLENEASSQLLLQDVRVLAIGDYTENSSKKEESGIYRTVTLELSPEEGAKLALTAVNGTVWLMLRSEGDSTTAGEEE